MADDNSPPEGLDEFLASPTPSSTAEPEGLEEFIGQEAKEEKYGSLGQQALAFAEGVGIGGSFGLSTGIERALGVAPEDIQGRREVNPGTHAAGEVAGLVGSAFIPVAGEANILAKAGQAGVAAVGMKAGAGFVNQVGNAAVRGAFEGALFQGGDEVSKMFSQDPSQTAETAITDIGLAGVLGGVFGGAFGAAAQGLKKIAPGRFISELDRPALDAGDFKTTIEHADNIAPKDKAGILEGLLEQKPDADEIIKAAQRLDAPVMEGMTSASTAVQKAEDSLINGAPTYSGLARQKLYSEGYKKAAGAVDDVVGAEGVYSKAELGNIMKDTIVKQLDDQNAPIKAMYDKIKQIQDIIPVEKDVVAELQAGLKEIKELRVAPSSAEGKMVQRVLDEVANSRTVDDLKAFKSTLEVSPTASSGERRMAGILRDKITQLEEDAIERYAYQTSARQGSHWAEGEFATLKAERKAASAQYKVFIQKVKTLSEQLGKGRVHGVQDAINFIRDLTPEQLTQRLFSKNDSEFIRFFAKEFPEQFELMKQYQKGLLRDAATRAGEFSPKVLFNNINKLEPEIQKSLFTPAELQRLRDAETYLRAFPKNFNPSGTSGMTAFRAFFEHPTGAAIANVRDYGIEKFLKLVSHAPEAKNAAALGHSTVKGWKTTTKAVKSVFSSAKDALPANVVPLITKREKLAKLVEEYNKNPEKIFGMNDNNPMEEYSVAFSATSARAVQYLNSLKPQTDPKHPLDPKLPANSAAVAAYNRALDIAQQPLVVLKHMKEGTLTSQDITTVRTIYPGLYNVLSQQLMGQVIQRVQKGEPIPYQTRMSLSLFLGQPLDSTLTPEGIMSAQPQPQAPTAANAPGLPGKAPASSSMKGLEKMPSQYRTPSQAAEMGGTQRSK